MRGTSSIVQDAPPNYDEISNAIPRPSSVETPPLNIGGISSAKENNLLVNPVHQNY